MEKNMKKYLYVCIIESSGTVESPGDAMMNIDKFMVLMS